MFPIIINYHYMETLCWWFCPLRKTAFNKLRTASPCGARIQFENKLKAVSRGLVKSSNLLREKANSIDIECLPGILYTESDQTHVPSNSYLEKPFYMHPKTRHLPPLCRWVRIGPAFIVGGAKKRCALHHHLRESPQPNRFGSPTPPEPTSCRKLFNFREISNP